MFPFLVPIGKLCFLLLVFFPLYNVVYRHTIVFVSYRCKLNECTLRIELGRHDWFSECVERYFWPIADGREMFRDVNLELILKFYIRESGGGFDMRPFVWLK